MRRAGLPLTRLEIGLDGRAGDSVVFESIEFPASGADVRASHLHARHAPPADAQRPIECVDLMPNIPRPFQMKDWQGLARGFDRFVFDFDAARPIPAAGLARRVAHQHRPPHVRPAQLRWRPAPRPRQTRAGSGHLHRRGLRRDDCGHRQVAPGTRLRGMCEAWCNHLPGNLFSKPGRLVFNSFRGQAGSFWYDLWPQFMFASLADRYRTPLDAGSRARGRGVLGGRVRHHGARFQPHFVRLPKMRPIDNGRWREPDGAAGIAWLEYAAWREFGEERFLRAADAAMQFLGRPTTTRSTRC